MSNDRFDYQQQQCEQEQQMREDIKRIQQELAWAELERRYGAASNLIQGEA